MGFGFLIKAKGKINEMMNMTCATMLDCPVRFHGEYGPTAVEAFLDYVHAYRAVKNITEEQCVTELHFLFEGHARAWFQLRERNLMSKGLQGMLTTIRSHFSTVTPPFQLYTQLYQPYMSDKESILHFVKHKLEILAQLPPPQHADSIKIDMIYGLLPKEVQYFIPRNDITNIEDFIYKVRSACEPQKNKPHSDEENRVPLAEQNSCQTAQLGSSISKQKVLNQSQIFADKHFQNSKQHQDVAISLNDSPEEVNSHSNVQSGQRENSFENNGLAKCQSITLHSDKSDTVIVINNDTTGGIDDEHQVALKEVEKFEIDSEIIDQINSIFDDYELSKETSDVSCETPKPTPMQTAYRATTTMIGSEINPKTHDAKTFNEPKIIKRPHKNKIVRRNLYTREVEPCSLELGAINTNKQFGALISEEESKHVSACRQKYPRKRKTAEKINIKSKLRQERPELLKCSGQTGQTDRQLRRERLEACIRLRDRSIAAKSENLQQMR